MPTVGRGLLQWETEKFAGCTKNIIGQSIADAARQHKRLHRRKQRARDDAQSEHEDDDAQDDVHAGPWRGAKEIITYCVFRAPHAPRNTHHDWI